MSDTLEADPKPLARDLGVDTSLWDTPDGSQKVAMSLGASPMGTPSPRQEKMDPWESSPLLKQTAAIIFPGEGAHGNSHAQNPVSSAGGLAQIIDDTWLDMMRKHHPNDIKGKSRTEILAMKYVPEEQGGLNKTVAAEYALDNAKGLQSAGLPVTPQTIAAAHRLGLGGATAALRAAPDTPLSVAAPNANTVGNEDIGGLTVGEFLANPYPGRAGRMDPAVQARLNRTAAMGNDILGQMLAQRGEDDARIRKLAKDYKPFHVPDAPKQPESDPLKAFGGIASIFVALASGLSRTPGVAAMNGLAGAIDGAREHDWHKYQTEYKAWKDGTEFALETHRQQSADMDHALKMLTTNVNAGHAMLQSVIAQSDDAINQKFLAERNYEAIAEHQLQRDKAAQELAKGRAEADASLKLNAATSVLDAANASGDPEQIARAKAGYDTALTRLRDIKSAPYAGRKGDEGKAAAWAKFHEENPKPTAEEITQFRLRLEGKEDPAAAGARKEAGDAERKRHALALEELAAEKNLTQAERNQRADAERERHNRATENKPPPMSAHERTIKVFEDDIRKDPKFAAADDSVVKGEAERRLMVAKKPEAAVLSKEAADMEATQFLLTGQMPSMGTGGVTARVQVLNRAAEMAQEQGHTIEDYLAGRATLKADASSLSQITKISDAVQGFENTALENMKVAESLMDKGVGTAAGPVINRWLQAGRRATGDADVAAFNTAMGTVAGEYGKIISGGSASIAATPEGARQEAAEWLDKMQSPDAIKAQFAVARRDMENRKVSLFKQRGLIQSRIRDPMGSSSPSAPPTGGGWHIEEVHP